MHVFEIYSLHYLILRVHLYGQAGISRLQTMIKLSQTKRAEIIAKSSTAFSYNTTNF